VFSSGVGPGGVSLKQAQALLRQLCGDRSPRVRIAAYGALAECAAAVPGFVASDADATAAATAVSRGLGDAVLAVRTAAACALATLYAAVVQAARSADSEGIAAAAGRSGTSSGVRGENTTNHYVPVFGLFRFSDGLLSAHTSPKTYLNNLYKKNSSSCSRPARGARRPPRRRRC
jgi:uncharacterized protein (DUF2336 family)